MSVEVYRKES